VITEIQIEKTVQEAKANPNATERSQKKVTKSKIRFVDLAGSEKINLETKEIVQEGANINKSLLALTNCINIMSDTK
jgi:kinesin family protein 18/19